MPDDNRIDPLNPPVSPTGVALIPTKVVPVVAAVMAIAAAVCAMVPEHTIAYKAAASILALGALFGVVSPGLRK